MLADVDELRQRMDQPENQSRMADERRQLDQTREEVQRASDAATEGSPSQALASGTRAQRQLTLSFCKSRARHGTRVACMPSRFLYEMTGREVPKEWRAAMPSAGKAPRRRAPR